jgi:hypothetical protein
VHRHSVRDITASGELLNLHVSDPYETKRTVHEP